MEKTAQTLSYSATTHDIRITAYPQFLENESNPARNIYSFAYTITIENYGEELVQLLSRHWSISSGGLPYSEVKGEGVVGQQPYLKPGEGFQYTSGSVIKDPVGSMQGEYTFINSSGELFAVEIPRFDLIYPSLVH
jgi:ApaG protein